jgi:hypothetical protein
LLAGVVVDMVVAAAREAYLLAQHLLTRLFHIQLLLALAVQQKHIHRRYQPMAIIPYFQQSLLRVAEKVQLVLTQQEMVGQVVALRVHHMVVVRLEQVQAVKVQMAVRRLLLGVAAAAVRQQ